MNNSEFEEIEKSSKSLSSWNRREITIHVGRCAEIAIQLALFIYLNYQQSLCEYSFYDHAYSAKFFKKCLKLLRLNSKRLISVYSRYCFDKLLDYLN